MTNHAFSLLIVALVAVVGLIGFLVVWIVCRDRKRRPILAMMSGIVKTADSHSATVDVGEYKGRPMITIYNHLDSIKVKTGQHVNQGDLIGYIRQNSFDNRD